MAYILGPIKLELLLLKGNTDTFKFYLFKNEYNYMVLQKGDLKGKQPYLSIRSICVFGHIFNSRRCDCSYQLKTALQRISDEKLGMIIYCLDDHGLWHRSRESFQNLHSPPKGKVDWYGCLQYVRR